MLLVFCILGVIILSVLLLLTLNIKIIIQGEKQSKNFPNEIERPLQFKISFYVLHGIKIGTKLITKDVINKALKTQENRVWDKFKKYEPKVSILLNDFENLKIKIERLNLNFHLGTENILLTSSLIVFLSSVLSIVLAKFVNLPAKEKMQYQILPYYQEKNQYNIKVDCIIQVKMVHIIYVIYRVIKRKEIDEHGKSSNRRSYEYSYE